MREGRGIGLTLNLIGCTGLLAQPVEGIVRVCFDVLNNAARMVPLEHALDVVADQLQRFRQWSVFRDEREPHHQKPLADFCYPAQISQRNPLPK